MSSQVWVRRCAVCPRSIDQRAVDARTCSDKHRQKLYRLTKAKREHDQRRGAV